MLLRGKRAVKAEKYVVAAPHYAAFRDWCRQHEVNQRHVTYVCEARDIHGLRDHNVVLIRGYHRHPLFRDRSDMLLRLLNQSLMTYYEWDVPVVEGGRIVGWW